MPVGYAFIDNDVEPVKCGAGTYWKDSDKTCPECAKGKFCPVDSNGDVGAAELDCPSGFYTDEVGASACNICPPGLKCSSTSSTPVSCNAGEFSLGGQQSCTSCPAGYECPSKGSIPVKCAVGTSANAGSEKCTACSDGDQCLILHDATNDPCPSGEY